MSELTERMLRQIDARDAIIAALLSDNEWHEERDLPQGGNEWVCRYCKAPFSVAWAIDHADDCPVARGLALVKAAHS